jgi:quercetin dioxygenase-like cupin family protein
MTSVTFKVSSLAAVFVVAATVALGADEPPKTPANTVTPLVTRDLAGVPGKEVVMITIEQPPGAAALPHRHDSTVYVYMLEGSVSMQVQGKEAVTLTPGQVFYESPDDIHVQAANLSKTKPAKFLVIFIKDKGAPATRAVSQ